MVRCFDGVGGRECGEEGGEEIKEKALPQIEQRVETKERTDQKKRCKTLTMIHIRLWPMELDREVVEDEEKVEE